MPAEIEQWRHNAWRRQSCHGVLPMRRSAERTSPWRARTRQYLAISSSRPRMSSIFRRPPGLICIGHLLGKYRTLALTYVKMRVRMSEPLVHGVDAHVGPAAPRAPGLGAGRWLWSPAASSSTRCASRGTRRSRAGCRRARSRSSRGARTAPRRTPRTAAAGPRAWPARTSDRRPRRLPPAAGCPPPRTCARTEAPRPCRACRGADSRSVPACPNEAVGLVPIPRLKVHRLVAFHEGAKLPDCA